MKYLIISGNPKRGGLCRALEDAIERGARDGGADVTRVTLEKVQKCRSCNGGWGICREQHKCAFGQDGFDELQAQAREADAYALVTPVYWGEVTEDMKAFIDRLRRCEFMQGALAGKKALIACSPGGSGNGMISAMEQLDRFCRHMGAEIFDYIGQNRWNAEYKQQAAYAAARMMAEAAGA